MSPAWLSTGPASPTTPNGRRLHRVPPTHRTRARQAWHASAGAVRSMTAAMASTHCGLRAGHGRLVRLETPVAMWRDRMASETPLAFSSHHPDVSIKSTQRQGDSAHGATANPLPVALA